MAEGSSVLRCAAAAGAGSGGGGGFGRGYDNGCSIGSGISAVVAVALPSRKSRSNWQDP